MVSNDLSNGEKAKHKRSRRSFLKRLGAITCFSGVGGLAYTYFESGWLSIQQAEVQVPNLPRSFVGMRIALLTDIHHGPYISLDHVKKLVSMTNALKPDFVMLGGDYVHTHAKYIAPCFTELRNLKSRFGSFGILGNHDYWESAPQTRQAMRENNIIELTNTGQWIENSGQRLRVAGVGDYWEDTQNLDMALGDTRDSDASILISHNPDYVEEIKDSRVGLVLSGHTHGGQVVLPVVGAPRVPSLYGQKYLNGLVKTDYTQVFVSKGLGAVFPPLRFCCRPEIALLTLK